MTRTRWLIAAFWILITGVLLKQCYDSGIREVQTEEAKHRQSYIFTPPPPAPAPPPAPNEAADVRQIKFVTREGVPGRGSFTCDVTIQNQGLRTAKNIQVHVRPYRGTRFGSIDVGHIGSHFLDENEPLSQYGSWILFGDLKPGETRTLSAIFIDHANATPGYNKNPDITFETEK